MIEELHVRDLALIENAWLGLGPGMTVLTGETGAGKTVLLGALKLLLGERADATSVRSGAAEAVVDGRLTTRDGAEMLIKRRVSADGRSRCSIDGEMATVGSLADRVGPLIDLHGQHDHQILLSSGVHLSYLDRWAGQPVAEALAEYREVRGRWADARNELDSIDRRIEEASRDASRLKFTVQEIGRVAPVPGEDDELEAALPALRNAEALAASAGAVAQLLRGDGGALDNVGAASDALSRLAGTDPRLDELGERLKGIAAQIDDLGMSARSYRDSVESDPAALERASDRLAALAGLKRSYGPTLQVVIETEREALASLEALEHGEESRADAAAVLAQLTTELEAAGAALMAARRDAIPGFVAALSSAVADLAMPSARFEVEVRETEFASWTADGPARVEFLYAPAPGQPARPLARIASGGEISRVMLALKSVLGNADTVETLVFDEVDAGIGGATGTAVGARLAQLARTHQVVVVTHLAQVAAFADAHLVVRKLDDDDGATTVVTPLEGPDKVAEIARMLSGNSSATALAHAEELIAAARSAH